MFKSMKELTKLKREESEFFPPVLEIQESPPSPIGRMILWLLTAFIVFMIVWATLGKVNIVATAQGKIIPNGKVKIIQPAITGVVEDIKVKDGDFVKEGDLLIVLDKTMTQSKIDQINIQLQDNLAKNIWLTHFFENIKNLKEIKEPIFVNDLEINKEIILRNRLLYRQELEEFGTKLKIQFSELARFENQKIEAKITRDKLNSILPLIKKREAAMRKLFKAKMASETEYLDLKQSLIEAEFNLKLQNNAIESLNIQIQTSKNQIEDLYSNKKLDLQNRITESYNIVKNSLLERKQHMESLDYHEIRSPINGYVQDLAIYTKGGSLNATEPALRIVPENDELIVEAMVLNKDIGFLSKGQETVVKVDTFNFVKHGSLSGVITDISNDAVQDENLGLVFKVKVKLNETKLFIENKYIEMNSGMSVVVEAKTGARRIIDFFFNPVKKSIDESLKERG